MMHHDIHHFELADVAPTSRTSSTDILLMEVSSEELGVFDGFELEFSGTDDDDTDDGLELEFPGTDDDDADDGLELEFPGTDDDDDADDDGLAGTDEELAGTDEGDGDGDDGYTHWMDGAWLF